jgi:hypothetical protein
LKKARKTQGKIRKAISWSRSSRLGF